MRVLLLPSSTSLCVVMVYRFLYLKRYFEKDRSVAGSKRRNNNNNTKAAARKSSIRGQNTKKKI